MVTQQMLHDLFEYRADGNLIRKHAARGKGNCAGAVVGYRPKVISRQNRYVSTKISGQHWCVHKLIYMYHFGEMPQQLDHINQNTLDNRIENLRPATSSQNCANRSLFSNNTSGCRGVSWNKRNKKWFVYVDFNKRRKNIGYFDDLDFADLVATEARDLYHGEYAVA
jgi:hypothetical protein